MINEQLKLRCNSSGACSADSIEAQTTDTVAAVHIDSIVSLSSYECVLEAKRVLPGDRRAD